MNPNIVEAIRRSRLESMPRRIKNKVRGIVTTFREHAAACGIDEGWIAVELSPGITYGAAISRTVHHLILRNTIDDSIVGDERRALYCELEHDITRKAADLIA